MAASLSAGLVRGKVARFTLLDACGNPVITNGTFTTKGIVTVNTTKNVDSGDEIKVRQFDGTIGEYEPGRVTVLNFTHEIQLIKVDPGFLTMLTGDAAVLNALTVPGIVGWTERQLQPLAQNFGLEVWTDTSTNVCATPGRLCGYMLYPMVGQAYLTIDNVGDKEITCTIHGIGYGNPQWGKGPYGGTGSIPGPVDSSTTGLGTASRLLVPVGADEIRHFELTNIPPPAPTATPGPASYTLPSPY